MKWNLSTLLKSEFPLNFSFVKDLSTELLQRSNDIISSKDVNVTGGIQKLGESKYLVLLNIKTELELRCHVSLESLEYNINVDGSEIYSNILSDEDEVTLINHDGINITDLVIDLIILNIPMKIVKKGYENLYSKEKEEEIKESPFSVLKDYFKDK